MGNVSRKAILKAATPALVLSAAVLFSAGAHAQNAAAEPSKSNVPESASSIGDRYESVQAARKMATATRNAIVESVKVIGDAEKTIEEFAVQKKSYVEAHNALVTTEKSFETAKAKYETRSGEDGFIAFDKLTYEQFVVQPEFIDALEKAIGTPAVADRIEFGSAVETMKSIKEAKGPLEANMKKLDKATLEAEKIGELHAAKVFQLGTGVGYLQAEATNILTPRGLDVEANAVGSWASGDFARAAAVGSTAFGTGAQAEGDSSTAVGGLAKARDPFSSAFGHKAEAAGNGSSALGYAAKAYGTGATATGAHAIAEGTGATALGARSIARASGTAIGAASFATEGATAIGAGAVADAKGAVAIGQGVVNKEANTVAFANGDDAKRLTHVADGKNDTDAVNVRQARTFQSTLRAEMDVSSQRAITQSNSYTDQKVGEIRKDMAAMDKSFRRGIASSAALMMSAPYAPGKVAATAGTALYRGSAAIAVGASYWDQSGTWNINGGISTAGGNSTIVRLGGSMLF